MSFPHTTHCGTKPVSYDPQPQVEGVMPLEGDGNQVQIPGCHGNRMREDGGGLQNPPLLPPLPQLPEVRTQEPQHFVSPQRQSWEQGGGDVPL